MNAKKYSGVIVPLVTPFSRNQKIDKSALEKLVEYVTKNHCAPFIFGTTGESASIAFEEFAGAAKAMVKVANGKSQTYAGISSNNLATSVKLANQMFDIGVSAVVAHPPNYYPLKADQILKYYENLVEAVQGPMLIYNIPATTHHSIPLDVVEKLSHHPNIVGIKDSERDLERMKKSIEMWSDRKDFVHLLGWGAELSNSLLLGSDGIVPSTGNITPHLYYMMYQETSKRHKENAQHLQKITDQFSQIYQKGKLLSESLAGLKIMLNEIGLCDRWVLPPLTGLDAEDTNTIIYNTRRLIADLKDDPFGAKISWS